MTENDPVEKLIDLTAQLIARAHLRRCSPQTQETNEQPDSPIDSVSAMKAIPHSTNPIPNESKSNSK